MSTQEDYAAIGAGLLPGHLGIEVLSATPERLTGRMELRPVVMAPNGFIHAGSLVTLADTLCGYGATINLPEGAAGFTTIELKTNFLGTVRTGAVAGVATPVHVGRTTHVWDAIVSDEESGRRLVVFRCTQLVLWPQ